MKFIYVFSAEARDKLLSKNFKLLKSDDKQNVFVFENNGAREFSLNDLEYVQSNTLTF